jgi:hypothetical protein
VPASLDELAYAYRWKSRLIDNDNKPQIEEIKQRAREQVKDEIIKWGNLWDDTSMFHSRREWREYIEGQVRGAEDLELPAMQTYWQWVLASSMNKDTWFDEWEIPTFGSLHRYRGGLTACDCGLCTKLKASQGYSWAANIWIQLNEFRLMEDEWVGELEKLQEQDRAEEQQRLKILEQEARVASCQKIARKTQEIAAIEQERVAKEEEALQKMKVDLAKTTL